jgi:hypothetical protein
MSNVSGGVVCRFTTENKERRCADEEWKWEWKSDWEWKCSRPYRCRQYAFESAEKSLRQTGWRGECTQFTVEVSRWDGGVAEHGGESGVAAWV